MAIPALARDFKEFLNSLNSNRVEYLLIGGHAIGISLENASRIDRASLVSLGLH
jgi:uncharacterized membrane protein YbhN (UPF0104 family)